MTTPPRVTGIGGVFFKTRDPASLGEWYRSHLGIDVQEGGWAVFRWRDHEDPSRAVADLDAVLADLRREGVKVDERVEETGEGRFGWISDPEGNRIELWQPPPDR